MNALFGNFSGLKLFSLTGSVGNMMDNNEEDVMKVKNALHATGYRDEPADSGIIEQKTDDAIKSFQKDNNLKVDGILKSGGETEDALNDSVSAQDKSINSIENVYRSYVQMAKKKGWTSAAENLEHYLGGAGENLVINSDKLRQKNFIQDGEKKNMERIISSLSDDQSTKVGSKLSKLNDGQAIGLQDSWDYSVEGFPAKQTLSHLDFRRSHILRGDIDEYLSTGSSNLKSSAMYYAKRSGDVINIEGLIDHNWKDRYDFKPGEFLADGALTLEHYKKATPFSLESKWKQNISGTVKIKDQKLSDPKFILKDDK